MRRFPIRGSVTRPALMALTCAAVLTLAGDSQAAPPGIPAGSQLVFNFNVIGYPADRSYDGNCGNGQRILVNRDAKSAHVLVQNSSDDWLIVDCDATADPQAILATYAVGTFDIYARILGKPGGNIKICADTLTDFQSGETLCLLGTLDLTRGKGQSRFQLQPASMFDASLQDLMWTIDTNADFRIVQFRVYGRP